MTRPKILAIDDDDMVLLYLKKKLDDRYTLITTTDPQSAMRLAVDEKPDLILCDIDMPDMDGGEVCHALSRRSDTANIPFMYLTSLVSSSEVRQAGGLVGGHPGVAKQAPLPELITAIDKMLPAGTNEDLPMTKPKILAIDDDDMVLLYLKKKIGDRYTLITTTDPASAVRLAMDERPDLILCDIDMPDMDGGEVCKALSLRSGTASIPFMYLTSLVSSSEVRQSDGMVGGCPGIAKQAPLPELIAAIDRLLPS